MVSHDRLPNPNIVKFNEENVTKRASSVSRLSKTCDCHLTLESGFLGSTWVENVIVEIVISKRNLHNVEPRLRLVGFLVLLGSRSQSHSIPRSACCLLKL
jgi:hypothetical protein